jgi:hypothetical protein
MKGLIIYHKFGPNEYFIGDKLVSQEEFDAAFPAKKIGVPMNAGNTPGIWPMKSDALAVHPEQIPLVLERNKRHGLTSVEYDPKDGRAIIPDRGARRMLNRIEKFHDNEGCYGD